MTGALVLNGAPVMISHVDASAQAGFLVRNAEDVRLVSATGRFPKWIAPTLSR